MNRKFEQEALLNKIDLLFKKIDLVSETSGVKPDEITEVLHFSYIDNINLKQPDVKSLASSRKEVFEKSNKSSKKAKV